jgi:hypothetical protein
MVMQLTHSNKKVLRRHAYAHNAIIVNRRPEYKIEVHLMSSC